MSAEHYMSHAILRELRDMLLINSRFGAERDDISPRALTVKALCARHNSTLGVLDLEALKVFRAIRSVLLPGQPPLLVETVDGLLFERWMLKLMAGSMLAKVYNLDLGSGQIPPEYVSILAGDAMQFPAGGGLHQVQLTHPFDAKHALVFSPVLRRDGGPPAGMMLTIHGLAFLLAFGPPESWQDVATSRSRRPEFVRYEHGTSGVIREIRFQWPETPGNPLHLRVTPGPI